MTLETIVTGASVVCGIGAFFALAILNAVEGRRNRLENLVVGAFVASAIPTGLILLACAFDPSLLQRMSGLNVHSNTDFHFPHDPDFTSPGLLSREAALLDLEGHSLRNRVPVVEDGHLNGVPGRGDPAVGPVCVDNSEKTTLHIVKRQVTLSNFDTRDCEISVRALISHRTNPFSDGHTWTTPMAR